MDSPRKQRLAMDHHSSDLFTVIHAVPNFWDILFSRDATQLRTTCSTALKLHRAWCPRLSIGSNNNNLKNDQVVQGLHKLASEGYRPKEVSVACGDLLDAKHVMPTLAQSFGSHLTSLHLRLNSDSIALGIPTEAPVAASWSTALAAALPAVHTLRLQFNLKAEGAALEPLLVGLGPRLRSLSLRCLWTRWLPAWLHPAVLPALQHLQIDSRGVVCWEDTDFSDYIETQAHHRSLQIVALQSLRSLELRTDSEGADPAVRVPDRELAPLSGLTGLTRLVMCVPQPNTSVYAAQYNHHDEVARCGNNCWPLAPLVANMSHLQELVVPYSYISAGDGMALAAVAVAASLTRLVCAGLATPPYELCGELNAVAAVARTATTASKKRTRGDRLEEELLLEAAGSSKRPSGGPVMDIPLVPLLPNLRELQVTQQLPSLHIAASLAAHPTAPLLVLWGMDEWHRDEYDERTFVGCEGGSQAPLNPESGVGSGYVLSMLGGVASRYGNALPMNNGVVQPWVVTAAAAGARYIADALARWERRNRRPAVREVAGNRKARVANPGVRGSRAGGRGFVGAAAKPLALGWKCELKMYEGLSDCVIRHARSLLVHDDHSAEFRDGLDHHHQQHAANIDDDYVEDDEDDYFSDDDADRITYNDGYFNLPAPPGVGGVVVQSCSVDQRWRSHRDGILRPSRAAGPHTPWLPALGPLVGQPRRSIPSCDLQLTQEDVATLLALYPKLTHLVSAQMDEQRERHRGVSNAAAPSDGRNTKSNANGNGAGGGAAGGAASVAASASGPAPAQFAPDGDARTPRYPERMLGKDIGKKRRRETSPQPLRQQLMLTPPRQSSPALQESLKRPLKQRQQQQGGNLQRGGPPYDVDHVWRSHGPLYGPGPQALVEPSPPFGPGWEGGPDWGQ